MILYILFKDNTLRSVVFFADVLRASSRVRIAQTTFVGKEHETKPKNICLESYVFGDLDIN